MLLAMKPSLDGVCHRTMDGPLARVKNQLIDVTPAPVLAGLEGSDDGVIGTVEMFGRVLVLGLVTAADMATAHAEPQVDPAVPDAEAVLAAICAGRHFTNLMEVGTGGHGLSPCRCGSAGRFDSENRPMSYRNGKRSSFI